MFSSTSTLSSWGTPADSDCSGEISATSNSSKILFSEKACWGIPPSSSCCGNNWAVSITSFSVFILLPPTLSNCIGLPLVKDSMGAILLVTTSISLVSIKSSAGPPKFSANEGLIVCELSKSSEIIFWFTGISVSFGAPDNSEAIGSILLILSLSVSTSLIWAKPSSGWLFNIISSGGNGCLNASWSTGNSNWLFDGVDSWGLLSSKLLTSCGAIILLLWLSSSKLSFWVSPCKGAPTVNDTSGLILISLSLTSSSILFTVTSSGKPFSLVPSKKSGEIVWSWVSLSVVSIASASIGPPILTTSASLGSNKSKLASDCILLISLLFSAWAIFILLVLTSVKLSSKGDLVTVWLSEISKFFSVELLNFLFLFTAIIFNNNNDLILLFYSKIIFLKVCIYKK